MERVGFLLMKALNQSAPAIDVLSHEGGRLRWYCTAIRGVFQEAGYVKTLCLLTLR